MSAFSETYYRYVRVALESFAGVNERLLYFRPLGELVPLFFRLQYALQRATTPITRLALQQVSELPPNDFQVRYKAFLEESLREELGHEEIQLRDLERLGYSRTQVTDWLPPPALTALVGSQFYLLNTRHPAVLLGYQGLLEAYAQAPESVARLVDESGLPSEAFSNYQLHAEIDGDHHGENVKMLEAVQDVVLQQDILANLIRSAELCCQALETLAEEPTMAASVAMKTPASAQPAT